LTLIPLIKGEEILVLLYTRRPVAPLIPVAVYSVLEREIQFPLLLRMRVSTSSWGQPEKSLADGHVVSATHVWWYVVEIEKE
jgi:hypothetical protein